MSPGNQILALTAKKAIPKSETIAKGKIFVLIKPKDLRLTNTIITCLRDFLKLFFKKSKSPFGKTLEVITQFFSYIFSSIANFFIEFPLRDSASP